MVYYGKLGFDDRWINWVKECVAAVSYSIVVEDLGYFKPNRGLRQGNPLSSYLFLLHGIGLSFLLHKAKENKIIQGLRISSKCPSISHLHFADDSLLFSKASFQHCANVLEILNKYESFSGQ